MDKNTFDEKKKDGLYKNSAIPFIERLINLNVPLSAIDTNDWHCNYMPRVYVTREFGRNNGGDKRKVHVSQFGQKSAKRLADFYHK